MNNETKKSALYFENLNSKKRVNVNQGGTSSGKTYTIIDMLFEIGATQKGQVITVVGQDIPNLKKGAYRDAKHIWGESEIYQQWWSKPNESDRIFTSVTGSIIEFNSYSNEQDAKSGKRDYLFVNEANGIDYNVYWQLSIRTRKKIYIDYNPSSRFWVHDKLIGKDDVKLIISDHRHNTFLTKEEHDRIESIDDVELHKVYARGKTGQIKGVIFTNWELVSEMPTYYKRRWIGLDFGFTNDPTGIIDVMLSEGELWLDEIEYKTGMLNKDIAECIKEKNLQFFEIIADSAEPKSIAELKTYGLKIESAIKGADSIKAGIQLLQGYKLNVTRSSKNLKTELLAYKWKEDKNGNFMNEPIDKFNHLLDPLRYVALNKLSIKPISKGIRKISY